MGKKFIFYLENVSRPVMITCNKENRSWEELRKELSEAITADSVAYFNTETDCLLLKPNKISGVYIEDLKESKHTKLDETEYDIFSDDDLLGIDDAPKGSAAEKVSTKAVVGSQILDELEEKESKISLSDAFDNTSSDDDSSEDDFLSRLTETVKTKTFNDDLEDELTEEDLMQPFTEDGLEDEIESELANLSLEMTSDAKKRPESKPALRNQPNNFRQSGDPDVVEVIEVDQSGNPLNPQERPELVGAKNKEDRINTIIENAKKKGSKNIINVKPVIRE